MLKVLNIPIEQNEAKQIIYEHCKRNPILFNANASSNGNIYSFLTLLSKLGIYIDNEDNKERIVTFLSSFIQEKKKETSLSGYEWIRNRLSIFWAILFKQIGFKNYEYQRY